MQFNKVITEVITAVEKLMLDEMINEITKRKKDVEYFEGAICKKSWFFSLTPSSSKTDPLGF